MFQAIRHSAVRSSQRLGANTVRKAVPVRHFSTDGDDMMHSAEEVAELIDPNLNYGSMTKEQVLGYQQRIKKLVKDEKEFAADKRRRVALDQAETKAKKEAKKKKEAEAENAKFEEQNVFKEDTENSNEEEIEFSVSKESLDKEEAGKEFKKVESGESHSGEKVSHTFQAETREILNIVANSLYTDKEVFIRELISNASDAMEKVRYLKTHDTKIIDSDRPLEMHITTDVDNNTITFQDFGVGMTDTELVKNLGTIARSGSKAFVKEFKEGQVNPGENGGTGEDNVSSIIGQFGVGFYSALMVGDRVDVYSQSCVEVDGKPAPANFWTTTGDGSYEMGEAAGVIRGTKIIIHLKENAKTFSVRHTIEGIVKKYSNFVGFPIFLNGEKVNTVDAIWTHNANEITEEQHTNFYRYIANAYDEPPFRLHFKADAPIDINALFYFPQRHLEKMGMGRLEPGVGVYSRKVLIQGKSDAILPPWCRFVKGVVDSEDIPLNISRENLQDSALISRLNTVLTKRIIKFLAEMGEKQSDRYDVWFKEFGQFIKEGVCSDFQHKESLAKLLRFDSSRGMEDAQSEIVKCSLDDYISRMAPEQEFIFYLSAPNRKYAMESPYFESFKKKNVEVLFLYENIDDFVMKNLGSFQKRKVVSIESTEASEHLNSTTPEELKEMEDRNADLLDFVQEILSERLSSVKVSNRLSTTPAIVVDHESASFRRMMSHVDASQTKHLPKQKLEINPEHPVFLAIQSLKDTNEDVAAMMVEQVFDNALIAADILDNPRTMLHRLNNILASMAPTVPGVKEGEVKNVEE